MCLHPSAQLGDLWGPHSGHLAPLPPPPLVKQSLAWPILVPRLLLLPQGLCIPDRPLPHLTDGETEVLKPVVTQTPAKTETGDSCRDFILVPREGTPALGAVWGNGGSVFPPSQQAPLFRAVPAPGVPADAPPSFLIPSRVPWIPQLLNPVGRTLSTQGGRRGPQPRARRSGSHAAAALGSRTDMRSASGPLTVLLPQLSIPELCPWPHSVSLAVSRASGPV